MIESGKKKVSQKMKSAKLAPTDSFIERHIGPSEEEVAKMLDRLGYASLTDLGTAVVPEAIQLDRPLKLGAPRTEHALLNDLQEMAERNEVYRSFIGMGYHDCITPTVIQRNVLENPGWYTQYTPYQAEIAQGRLEALINFQTMVSDLTALPLANSSLLDEATAAAEAMAMCRAITRGRKAVFLADPHCHPQTLSVLRTRADGLDLDLRIGGADQLPEIGDALCGMLVQYPTSDGRVEDHEKVAEQVHSVGGLLVVAADLLALTLLRPPGEFGADIAVGSTQRFGVPLGYGGPHAAYLSTAETHKRQIPGRIVGVSVDDAGAPAFRLAMQTREQHIRRDKATSNICTAQVLLAVMASMYAVYHGPSGLRRIAERVHDLTRALSEGLRRLGHDPGNEPFFDTVRVRLSGVTADEIRERAEGRRINLRYFQDGSIGLAMNEAATEQDLRELFEVFGSESSSKIDFDAVLSSAPEVLSGTHLRTSEYLTHEVFRRYRSEHEMLRYLTRLQGRDLSLTHSMIPLGSCTMKLNGTSQMVPVSWPEFSRLHPYAPGEQTRGYAELFEQLESWLCEITGFSAFSLQPNAGAQGEYAGLLVLQAYHRRQGQGDRDVCLIPTSAHGTNPASAVMAGMRVVPVACDDKGNIDVADLEAKAKQHAARLAALMITYPSTHGVFEEEVVRICSIVHEHGGQVYMDGANMNAQVGLCRPGDIGADVCHLNLHKTFCIPHGGGGPGMGPIGVAEHLSEFLPRHPLADPEEDSAVGAVSAANHGSPSILPISWVYIALMGASGLKRATQVAILNANYMAHRLSAHYGILYSGKNGLVAHEFIIDLRPFKQSAGISVDDVAKRLMDFGIHAPTMSWPVVGTMMIEPTESESLRELDRVCDAMIRIREEIRDIEEGRADRENNLLTRAPHTASSVAADDWDRPYSRKDAAFPTPDSAQAKFWPAVGRIDNAYGDRNLICSCPPMESYSDS